jgi:hypothetical protein
MASAAPAGCSGGCGPSWAPAGAGDAEPLSSHPIRNPASKKTLVTGIIALRIQPASIMVNRNSRKTAGREQRPAPVQQNPLDQYESELITSPPLRLPSAHQVCGLTELLMNRTEPSAKASFTPPGCWLFAEAAPYGPT